MKSRTELPLRRRIYVDLDDVLCETARAYLGLLEEHFGKTATFASMHSFDLGISFSLNPDELRRLMELAHEDNVLKHTDAVPGAKHGLDRIRSIGYDVIIVTGRPAGTEGATRWWLDQQRMPYQELLFVDKYGRADPDRPHGRQITLEALCEMTFGYAIEDSWDMALFLSERMGLPVVLMDRPWNRMDHIRRQRANPGIKRCVDWVQVQRHLSTVLIEAPSDA